MVYALSIDDDQKLAAYGIQHSLLYHHQDSAKKKKGTKTQTQAHQF